jgi:hypothetical protein
MEFVISPFEIIKLIIILLKNIKLRSITVISSYILLLYNFTYLFYNNRIDLLVRYYQKMHWQGGGKKRVTQAL